MEPADVQPRERGVTILPVFASGRVGPDTAGLSRSPRREVSRNYSSDITLDTRQIESHFPIFVHFFLSGWENVNVEETIDATCRNAGEIEFIWENKEKKASKVMLFMDVGGSMTPYAELLSTLFSAATSQISKFRHYYFHNCIYQELWTGIERNKSLPTNDILRRMDPDYRVIIVGDGEMAPSGLTWVNGAIELLVL